jgi:hypothetical protein
LRLLTKGLDTARELARELSLMFQSFHGLVEPHLRREREREREREGFISNFR